VRTRRLWRRGGVVKRSGARLKLVAVRADTNGMEALEHPLGTVVVLEYPNKRTVETTLPTSVSVGDQFEMHGRRWQAVGNLEHRRARQGLPTRVLCRSLGRRTVDVIDDPRD
jgi:hypothetical protein